MPKDCSPHAALGLIASSLSPICRRRALRPGRSAVVEAVDERTVPVEFSADDGRVYAIASCSYEDLLVLH